MYISAHGSLDIYHLYIHLSILLEEIIGSVLKLLLGKRQQHQECQHKLTWFSIFQNRNDANPKNFSQIRHLLSQVAVTAQVGSPHTHCIRKRSMCVTPALCSFCNRTLFEVRIKVISYYFTLTMTEEACSVQHRSHEPE